MQLNSIFIEQLVDVNSCVRGGEIVDENSENLTIHDLGPHHRDKLSCSAVNSVGEGDRDIVHLEIFGKKKSSIFK